VSECQLRVFGYEQSSEGAWLLPLYLGAGASFSIRVCRRPSIRRESSSSPAATSALSYSCKHVRGPRCMPPPPGIATELRTTAGSSTKPRMLCGRLSLSAKNVSYRQCKWGYGSTQHPCSLRSRSLITVFRQREAERRAADAAGRGGAEQVN
jgi:hypothetical protein